MPAIPWRGSLGWRTASAAHRETAERLALDERAGAVAIEIKVADAEIPPRFLQVRRVFGSPVPADGSAGDLPRWDEQNTAMVLEWLSTLGREAVRAGGPVEAADVFPSRRSGVPWRAVILPLSTTGDIIDTLLCCVRMEPER